MTKKTLLFLLFLCTYTAFHTAFALPLPTFEKTTCPTTYPVKNSVICGTVQVPLEYRSSTNQFLSLQVAIIKSQEGKNNPPLIYLEGGPGGNGLIPFDNTIFEAAKHRDLVLIAQRGTGFSKKINYSCDGINVYGMHAAEGMKKCRQSLLDEGVNFEAFTVENSAEDIYTIIRALGYKKVDLYGVSYGTDLALAVMQLHPDVIHASVLDSVIPPQIFPLTQAGPDGFQTISTVLNDCKSDTKCFSQFPSIENDFYNLLTKLEKNPITVRFPYHGEMTDVTITIDTLLDSISNNYDGIPYLPAAIHQLAVNQKTNYQFKQFGAPITRVFAPILIKPMQFSIATFWLTACQSLYSGETNESIQHSNQGLPLQLRTFYDTYGKSELANCDIWFPDHHKVSIKHTPVYSTIPTLIFSGVYDGALDSTPASWAKATAQDLTHSYFYSFPRTGHVSLKAGICPLQIMNTFLQDPNKKPNGQCIQQIKRNRPFV